MSLERGQGHDAFKGLLWKFEEALLLAEKGYKVLFVDKQGYDRSILLARVLLEVLGLEEVEAWRDMLLLHCSCTCWRCSGKLCCFSFGLMLQSGLM